MTLVLNGLLYTGVLAKDQGCDICRLEEVEKKMRRRRGGRERGRHKGGG